MKKKHGWIIQNYKTKLFYGELDVVVARQAKLRGAVVISTRKEARIGCFERETVRKVSCFKTGKAKAIIGKG